MFPKIPKRIFRKTELIVIFLFCFDRYYRFSTYGVHFTMIVFIIAKTPIGFIVYPEFEPQISNSMTRNFTSWAN